MSPLDEAKGIRDQAEAIRVYAKSARLGLGIQNYAALVKILAEQRGGDLLSKMDKSKGGRGKTSHSLRQVLGVKTQTEATTLAHRWQTMADRIQARAIRRCGELLRQIEDRQGMRTDRQLGSGADPKLSRSLAADNAGLSRRQKQTALRVANVPDESFASAVESDDPPTVTALAKLG